MVRKIAHIVLAFLLLISTMGFSVSKHYCGTHLVGVSFNTIAKSCCNDEGTSKCCHNEIQHFQIQEDFIGSAPATIVEISPLEILFPVLFTTLLLTTAEITLPQRIVHDSPPPPNIHTHLALLQSYLI